MPRKCGALFIISLWTPCISNLINFHHLFLEQNGYTWVFICILITFLLGGSCFSWEDLFCGFFCFYMPIVAHFLMKGSPNFFQYIMIFIGERERLVMGQD